MEGITTDQERFDHLCFYTLAHGDRRFIHQLAVDAFTAQHAGEATKAIAVAFALIGLYLHLERGYSGRQVQLAHTKLAKKRKQWPRFEIPAAKGEVTVAEVVAAPPGPERDAAIERWCASVWAAWSDSREQVKNLVEAELSG